MTDAISINPAEEAAKRALASVYSCIESRKDFRLEAGAGAGKTYSLVKALHYLIDKHGAEILHRHQKIACITYTNVASDEIISRTDGHPAILASTIHSFCWLMIKDFQPHLRERLSQMANWQERIAESGGIKAQRVEYELGYRKITEEKISLGHDDVLSLMVKLMEQAKFRALLTARYPILLIDEYQDTNKEFTIALKTHFVDMGEGPLIGFFGDHWQKIYSDGCGTIEHPNLEVIGKKANFRSVPVIVEVLNRMRPELPQEVNDPKAEGSVAVYHTNNWVGVRRTGQHWDGDLPAEVAHSYLETLKAQLISEGWDFSPERTKILMLTHNVLAKEQGYSNLAQVFTNNQSYIKKEDPHIAFLVDTLEPVCIAYENKRYGEMFAVLGGHTPSIHSHADKAEWTKDMDKLLELRSSGTIGSVLDHLRQSKRPHLPDVIEQKERELEAEASSTENSSSIEQLSKLRGISYQEIIALSKFVNEKTPFSTKHGVKGAEFENVLVVIGRGWNHYNFNQFLEWSGKPDKVLSGNKDAFERNRNLFYVACSRPVKHLTLLFTQKLSDQAVATLSKWFGDSAIKPAVFAE